MKSSVTFIFVLICTVVLAAKTSQAKKGCNSYGMACYGGHGKRAIVDNNNAAAMMGSDLDGMPSEMGLRDNNIDELESNPPPYRLIRIIRSWFNEHPRRYPTNHLNDVDYPTFAENSFNNERTYN